MTILVWGSLMCLPGLLLICIGLAVGIRAALAALIIMVALGLTFYLIFGRETGFFGDGPGPGAPGG